MASSNGTGTARPGLLWAIAAGVVLGATYAFSPLTVWFLAAMVPLFIWAGRGLTDRERRWVFALLAAATAFRLIAVALLFLTYGHDLASF